MLLSVVNEAGLATDRPLLTYKKLLDVSVYFDPFQFI